MTTPIPEKPLPKANQAFQKAFQSTDAASETLETSLPSDLTVETALTRWRESRAPRFEPLLAAGELHGVMPRARRRRRS